MAIQAVRDVLINASAVTALVPAERITPLIRPQSIMIPAITLQRITLVPVGHLRNEGRLDENAVQLDIWAVDYANVRAIAEACRTALEAAEIHLTFEQDSYEPDVDPELYHTTQNWNVWTT